MHETTRGRSIGLHEIFKFAHLKFTVYGRKHTHNFRNAVTLVSSLVPGAEEERLVHTDALPVN